MPILKFAILTKIIIQKEVTSYESFKMLPYSKSLL